MIYLVHLDRPLGHARHYIGYTGKASVQQRLKRHRAGRGARLLRVCNREGIEYRVVRVWRGTRKDERRLKKRGGAAPLCPICRDAPQPVGYLTETWRAEK